MRKQITVAALTLLTLFSLQPSKANSYQAPSGSTPTQFAPITQCDAPRTIAPSTGYTVALNYGVSPNLIVAAAVAAPDKKPFDARTFDEYIGILLARGKAGTLTVDHLKDLRTRLGNEQRIMYEGLRAAKKRFMSTYDIFDDNLDHDQQADREARSHFYDEAIRYFDQGGRVRPFPEYYITPWNKVHFIG